MSYTRRTFQSLRHRLILIPLALILLAACSPVTSSGPGSEPAEAPFIPVLAASELEVGQNRMPLGIIKKGKPINDPNLTPKLTFYYLDGEDKTAVQGEAEALYRAQGLPLGLYVAYPTLDKPGAWAVEVTIPGSDGVQQSSRLRIDVLEKGNTPPVGSPAIPSKNLTAADVPDLKQLSSDGLPDPDLYQLTIADAIAAKKPFLVAFSTPGFCQTAVCGPNLDVIKKLKNDLKDQVNFIHVEVYPYPFGQSFERQQRVPAMEEWSLRTEPWTFLVDANGVIQAKYEGGLTFVELEPALKQLSAGQSIQPLAGS
jgi:hypothetical protein